MQVEDDDSDASAGAVKSCSKIARENGIKVVSMFNGSAGYVHECRYDIAELFCFKYCSYLNLVIYICIYFATTYAVTSS